jgi:hypothetical protein
MVVVRYKVSNGVEFFKNLTKATVANGVKGVHKLVLKRMTGKNKIEKAVAKAAAAMERTKPATRSDKLAAAAAAASRDKQRGGEVAAARDAETVDRIRTSTPNKRKGDDMLASERDTKKATVEEDSDSDVEEIEVDEMTRDDKYKQFCAGMRRLVDKYPQEKKEVEMLMKLMNGIIQDTRKVAAEEARKTVSRDAEYLQCTESVMMYNVHKIKFRQNVPIYEVSTFEEKLTDEIHHLTMGRVQVMKVDVMQRAENGKPMTVKVKLGSQKQRGMLYKLLGVAKNFVPESHEVFAGIAFRDCFPFEMLQEVRRLSGEGMEAKRNGECVAFRVTSQGGGAIPILQIRRAHGDRWAVYVRMEKPTRPEPRPRSRVPSMEVERDRDVEVSNLWHEMPPSFTKREVSSDPEFRVRINMAEEMWRKGEGRRALEEWREDMIEMEDDIVNFQGREIVKGRMQEIADAYLFTFNQFCDKVGANPMLNNEQ